MRLIFWSGVILIMPWFIVGSLFLSPPLIGAQNNGAISETFVIGYSVLGRPIVVNRIGTGSRSMVLVGGIHGDEGNSVVLARDLQNHFAQSLHLFPPDTSLYIIEVLNPDGLVVNSRYNANGVDLNRNWATSDWVPDSVDASGPVPGGGGTGPFSEPESRGMAEWLLQLRDRSSTVRTVFYHSAFPPNGLVLRGSVGAPLTPAYARIVGYAGTGSGGSSWEAYPVTGQAPTWCRDNGIGCFEVELPSRANLTAAQTLNHATAVLSVLMWEQVAPDQRCFLETGFCVSGRFRTFWQEQGSLATFGMPTSLPQEQPVDGVVRQVQWFERNRLELHPELAAPYDVQVGRIGVERLEQQGRDWWTFPRPSADIANDPDCRYFPESGQAICGAVRAAWLADGLELDGRPGYSDVENLALFGLPLSEPQVETLVDGQDYTVQWFERARFEIHPDGSVRLGLLGSETLQAQNAANATR